MKWRLSCKARGSRLPSLQRPIAGFVAILPQ
jgi:hypothetical protein